MNLRHACTWKPFSGIIKHTKSAYATRVFFFHYLLATWQIATKFSLVCYFNTFLGILYMYSTPNVDTGLWQLPKVYALPLKAIHVHCMVLELQSIILILHVYKIVWKNINVEPIVRTCMYLNKTNVKISFANNVVTFLRSQKNLGQIIVSTEAK